METLEDRRLLASDWQNSCNALDINNDQVVVPQDVLVGINELNFRQVVGPAGQLPPRSAHTSAPFFDTNGDGIFVPTDLLRVINVLNGVSPEPWFSFAAELENDTGPQGATNDDGLTSDPRISGSFAATLGLTSLLAALDGGAAVPLPQTCGGFAFDPGLADDGSADGPHVVEFRGHDPANRIAAFTIEFTLDTVPPELTAAIAPESDTGRVGDGVTDLRQVTFSGKTEPGVGVSVGDNGLSTAAAADGEFVVAGVSLESGRNTIVTQAEDLAGNRGRVDQTIFLDDCGAFDPFTTGLIGRDTLPIAGAPIPLAAPVHPGEIAGGNDGEVGVVLGLLDGDLTTDLVTTDPLTDEVLVFLGQGDVLQQPTRYPSGGDEPTRVAVGGFFGPSDADIAVGHRDGSVTFLEGNGDGSFDLRDVATLSGLGVIRDLLAADFDNNGETDLVVSSGDRVYLIRNDQDLLRSGAIKNGEFTQGLVGWNAAGVGQQLGQTPGSVAVAGEAALLVENHSLLVTLEQSFVVPPSPQQLTLDIVSQDFESSAAIPDAFEISLLDVEQQSMVPTFDDATSFFNLSSAGVLMAEGVTFDGVTVTVDISSLEPGTQVTLYLDLVGNPPGTSSVVGIDNVAVTPEVIAIDSFTVTPLDRVFLEAARSGFCDANADDRQDLQIYDRATDQVTTHLGDGAGSFTAMPDAGVTTGGPPAQVPASLQVMPSVDVVATEGFVHPAVAEDATVEGEATDRTVQLGELISDAVDVAGEVDRFTFLVEPNQRLYFDAQEGSPSQLEWTLAGPAGEVVFEELFRDQEIEASLAGSYTLSVGGRGDATAEYRFQIFAVPPTQTRNIQIGDETAGAFQVPGEQDEFQFSAQAGQILYFDRLQSPNAFVWRLLDPHDEVVFEHNSFGDQGPLEVQTTGVHRIEIDPQRDLTGEYLFRILEVPDPSTFDVLIGAPVSGRIRVPGEVHHFRFDAAAGANLFADAQDMPGEFDWTLRGPSGSVLFDGRGDQGPLSLDEAGQFLITLDPRADGTGYYQFVLWDLPSTPPREIAWDTPVFDAIVTPGEMRTFEFDGIADQQLAVDVISLATGSHRMELLDPSGNVLFTRRVTDQTIDSLPETGRYRLTIDPFDDNVGPFSFQITGGDIPDVPPHADLQVSDVEAPRRVVGNPAEITVGWKVTNQGDVAVPSGTVITDAIYLSVDDDLDKLPVDPLVTRVDTMLDAPLLPGETVERLETVTLFADLEAEFKVVVSTDVRNQVFENQSETDSAASSPVAVYSQPRVLAQDPVLQIHTEDGLQLPAGTSLTLSGRAAVRPGAVNAVFLIDLSGSTALVTDVDANYDGVLDETDDINQDGRVGDLLDKQIGLVTGAIARLGQRIDDLRVAVVGWGSSTRAFPDGFESLDLSEQLLDQVFRAPGADDNDNAIADEAEATESLFHRAIGLASHSGAKLFKSFFIGSGTSFEQALQELMDLLDAAPDADLTQVFLLQDGIFDAGNAPTDQQTIEQLAARGVLLRAAQVSGDAHIDELERIATIVDAHPDSQATAVIVETPAELDNLPFTNSRLSGVTIDNRGVDRLDSSGNFFTTVTLEAGENVFTISAIDSLGNETAESLTIVGLPANELDLSEAREVTELAQPRFRHPTFNRQSSTLLVDVALTNQTELPLKGPVFAVVDAPDRPVVRLSNADGLVDSERPYVEFDSELIDGVLPPLSETGSIRLQMSNPSRDRFELQVSLLMLGNQPPAFSSVPTTEITAGEHFVYMPEVNDDDVALIFKTATAPPAMTVDPSSGTIHWQTTLGDVGRHQVDLLVEDGFGGVAQQTFEVAVVAEMPNRPPLFRSSPTTEIDSGGHYAYQAEAFDADGDPLTYSLDRGPAELAVDSATGEVSWASPPDGEYEVILRVDDGQTGSSTQALVLTVGGAAANPGAPQVFSTPTLLAAVSTPYWYLPVARDPDGDSLVFSLVTFPEGMAIDATTGRVDWEPSSAALGVNPVVLRVDDGRGSFATQLFSIEVLASPPNLPPSFSTVPALLATQDEQYQYDVSAVDVDGDAITFVLVEGPQSMTLDAFTGALEFTPTASQRGVHRVQIQAVDGCGEVATQAYQLTVRPPNEAPHFTSQPSLHAVVGEDYRYRVEAEDVDDDLRFSVVGPPAGMRIDALTGLLTFTPQAGQTGEQSVTIRATDERGAIAEQHVTLTVDNDIEPPDVAIVLSQAVVDPNTQVQIQAFATDNVAVDAFELTIDALPVTLDGIRQAVFTPAAPGLYSVELRATDTSGNASTDQVQLRVIDPHDHEPPEIEILSPSPGATVTYLTEIVGSITGDDVESYELDYARFDLVDLENVAAESQYWRPIGSGSGPADNQVLGEFDTTVLENDVYLVRVTAVDESGNSQVQAFPLNVAGDAKLGDFALEVTDLPVPLGGIPIEVKRRYSTMDAERQGDFGFGWSLGVFEGDLRESLPTGNEQNTGIFGAVPFRSDTRVYITDPDGRRVGYSFDPQPRVSLLGTVFLPKFKPDPGVYDRLEVDDTALTQQADGTFTLFALGLPYNPRSYRLVRADGTVYHYDQFQGIQAVEDLYGNALQFTEDAITHSSGEAIRFARDQLGRIVEMVSPDGSSVLYDYDPRGNLSSVTDQSGIATHFDYREQPAHYLDKVLDANGLEFETFEFDDQGRLVAIIDRLGNRQEQSWDPVSFTGTYTDARGNVTQISYDDRGNVLKSVDPLGGAFHWQYDEDNNVTQTTDELGYVTSFTYDERGNMLTETDALGGVTSYTYSGLNQPTSITDTLGRKTSFAYDASGGLIGVTNPDGAATTLERDEQGRAVRVIAATGDITELEYGSFGLPERVVRRDNTALTQSYSDGGLTLSRTDAAGATTTFTYDAGGRMLTSQDTTGAGTSYVYDEAKLVRQTSALGATTRYEYDEADRVSTMIDPAGGRVQLTYDVANNLASLSDPSDNTVHYVHDALDRLTERVDALGQKTLYEYDAVGNVTQLTDRNGDRRTFAYDALRRPVTETWLAASGQVVNQIQIVYDAVGNVVSLADAHSSYSFTYDTLDRLTSVDNAGTPRVPHTVLTYSYDTAGNFAVVEDSSGVRIELAYDQLDRATSMAWGGDVIDPARVDFAYSSTGDLVQVERFADLEGQVLAGRTSIEYDSLGQVSQMAHRSAVDAAIAEYDYEYDAVGQLLREAHHGQTFDYAYDATGQLLEARRSVFGDETFAYDPSGNRTNDETVTGAGNRIEVDDRYTYEYDAEGSLIRRVEIDTGEQMSFEYDHRHRLTRIQRRDAAGNLLGEIEYVYDIMDNRITKIVDGEALHTVYDGDNAWADFDDDGEVVAYYLFGNRVDQIVARYRPAEGTAWYLTDRLGSVRDLADGSGELIAHVDYGSYGNVIEMTHGDSLDRFLFTGREYEAETDFYYYRARFYDPESGRFLSQDPLGFDGGDANLYRYVSNSPLNGTDPSGLTSSFETRLLAGAQYVAAHAFCYAASLAFAYVTAEVLTALEFSRNAANAGGFVAGLAVEIGCATAVAKGLSGAGPRGANPTPNPSPSPCTACDARKAPSRRLRKMLDEMKKKNEQRRNTPEYKKWKDKMKEKARQHEEWEKSHEALRRQREENGVADITFDFTK